MESSDKVAFDHSVFQEVPRRWRYFRKWFIFTILKILKTTSFFSSAKVILRRRPLGLIIRETSLCSRVDNYELALRNSSAALGLPLRLAVFAGAFRERVGPMGRERLAEYLIVFERPSLRFNAHKWKLNYGYFSRWEIIIIEIISNIIKEWIYYSDHKDRNHSHRTLLKLSTACLLPVSEIFTFPPVYNINRIQYYFPIYFKFFSRLIKTSWKEK